MRKLLAVFAIGTAFALSQTGVASADVATITANVTAGSIGLRSLTSVPAITLTPTAGVATVQGSMTAVVTEAAVTGTNPWSVTTALSTLTKGADTLANSNVDISNRATVKVAGGGTAAGTSGTEALSATRTLTATTGQSTAAVYSGTYTTTADLALNIPNGTVVGIYTGTMTVTLVQ